VRSYHPDVNATPEAAARIRLLNAAYAVLSDSRERARYDLERRRVRRRPVREPADFSMVTETASGSVQPRARRARAEQTARPPEMRFPLLGGQVLMGLICIVAVAAIVVVLLWLSAEVGA
jgi:curved DNA-binding protein CbpA